MNRLLAAALAAAALLGLLAGCGGAPEDARIYGAQPGVSPQAGPEDAAVTFFGFKADAMNLVAIENALHGFMAETPGPR